MKKIYLLSGIVALLATPVLGALNYPDFDVTGEIRAKGVKTNNTVDFRDYDKATTTSTADDDAIAKTRVRVNMKGKLSDGITANLQLQYGVSRDSVWGNAGANGPSITTIEGMTGVRHAYLAIDDITGDILPVDIDLTLGRQSIGRQSSGNVYRELVLYVDSINAKVAKATFNDLTVTGIWALQTEDGTTNNGGTDTTIKAIFGSYPLPVGETILCGHFLRAVTNNPNEDLRDTNNVYGFKVDGSMEIASQVNYFFEYAKQTGSDTTKGAKRDASALRIGGGYETELANLGAVAVEGSYLSMSGDKDNSPATVGNYTGIAPSYNYFSAMLVEGVIGLAGNGLKALNLNASISPEALEGVTLGFSYTIFASPEWVVVSPTTKAEGHMGDEIDLTCSYKYNDKTNIDLTYARFSPEKVFFYGEDPASMLKCQLITKF